MESVRSLGQVTVLATTVLPLSCRVALSNPIRRGRRCRVSMNFTVVKVVTGALDSTGGRSWGLIVGQCPADDSCPSVPNGCWLGCRPAPLLSLRLALLAVEKSSPVACSTRAGTCSGGVQVVAARRWQRDGGGEAERVRGGSPLGGDNDLPGRYTRAERTFFVRGRA